MRYKIGYPWKQMDQFNKDIQKGWRPHGSPFYDKDGVLCQAITYYIG